MVGITVRINGSLSWWAAILSVRSETLNLTLQHCLLYWSHYFLFKMIIVQHCSGLRHDHRVTLWLPTSKVFEGMEQVWFLNFMLLLNHKQLSVCVCEQLEVGLPFSFKPSASRQTARSHPDKPFCLISSQPLLKGLSTCIACTGEMLRDATEACSLGT